MSDQETLKSVLSAGTMQLALAIAVVVSLYQLYFTIWRPVFPGKGVALLTEGGPILGASRWWSARLDFLREWTAKGQSVMNFYVGRYQVINVSGEANRIAFLEDKNLGLGEGYFLLTGGSTGPLPDGRPFGHYFVDSFKKILRGEQLLRNFPDVLNDLRSRIDALAEDTTGITDPFKSVYEIVFQLTMRTVGCNEVANDTELVKETMRLNRIMELVGTPMAIMFPWFPSPGVIRKYYAGTKLYMIFDKVAKARRAEGRKEADAMQVLLDQGDSVKDIVGVVIGSLFAGQLNSGINAAWVLTYLAANPEWQQKVRDQIVSVAAKHCKDSSQPLVEQLYSLPMSTWEIEFPLIDLCLRDSIRLQMVGTLLRQNISGRIVKVGDAFVPNDAFVSYLVADIHHDAAVYQDPERWDPSRYLPERSEHTKRPYAYVGWGAGKHPCLGMRFAKLEQVLITAIWLAMFEYEIVDKNGQPTMEIPRENMNGFSAQPPDRNVYFKYKLRGRQ